MRSIKGMFGNFKNYNLRDKILKNKRVFKLNTHCKERKCKFQFKSGGCKAL